MLHCHTVLYYFRVYHLIGEVTEALPLYHRALAINRSVYGFSHPVVAACLNNLGALHQSLGNIEGNYWLFLLIV